MGCTGKLRLCLIDAPPRPKVSYFKDKVRQPAEVLGTPKTAISVEPCTLPSKARSGQANSDILYRQSPNSTTKGTKEHEGTLYYSTLCANSRRSWFKIRKLHLRILDHLLLAGAPRSLVPLPRPERSSFLLNWHRP